MRSNHSFLWVAVAGVLAAGLCVSASCAPPQRTTSQPAVKTSRGAAKKPIQRPTPTADDPFDANLVPGRIHFVQPNETLYSLAERYYGHGKHWRKILRANRHRVKNATVLPVGMRLIIP